MRASLALVGDMAPEQVDGGDFGQLAELHRSYLQRIALRLSGNADTAKDLVQETLLRAFRHFDQFQAGTHAGTWFSTILTHLFLDHLKHQRVERNAEPDLAAPEAIEPASSSMIASIADTELYAAVEALEPELREVVELCYLKQLRYREAGAILNVPVSTIGTRLMRARARLRELLAQHEPDVVIP